MALTRGVPAGLITALASHFHPVLLTEGDWPDGFVRVHTGTGTLSWDSKSWLGTGYAGSDGEYASLVDFAAPEEDGGLATSDATLRVAATVEGMLGERGKVIRNRDVRVYFGATTTAAGNVLVADPVLIFTGYFDSRTFSLQRAGTDLSHDMVLGLGIGPSARAAASITHGYEDQITKYPGDTAGRQVQNAIKKALNPPVWPEP